MGILEPLKNLSESWKSPGNLFLKKGANPVEKPLSKEMQGLVFQNKLSLIFWRVLKTKGTRFTWTAFTLLQAFFF